MDTRFGTMTGLTVSSWASGMGSLTPDDFSYLAIVQASPSMLYAPEGSEFKTYQDLLDYTKANPGKVRVATAGLGTLDDLTIKFLGTKGHEMKNVPYAKPAERYISPLGGHTEILYEEPGTSSSFSNPDRSILSSSSGRNATPGFPMSRPPTNSVTRLHSPTGAASSLPPKSPRIASRYSTMQWLSWSTTPTGRNIALSSTVASTRSPRAKGSNS